jgi:hypothetical protein
MEAVFPDLSGLSVSLLVADRRRPGSPVSGADIESVFTVVVKRAYTVQPSATPGTGSLAPRADGPKIFQADQRQGDAIRYESDLVAYKPEADLIVLPSVAPVPLSVAVDGTIRMLQPAGLPPLPDGLAWEGKVDTPRAGDGGDFSVRTQKLPDVFDNRYFNGYRRDRRQGSSVPYPPAGATIAILREDGATFGFRLPASAPLLRHDWYVGHGKDDPALWLRRDVPLALDTLVVEPDSNHAYAVWRAAWPKAFDPGGGAIPEAANRRVVVTLAEG